MSTAKQLHVLGVMCGVAAGAWLGAAEAPTKLVTIGISPFVISLAMVIGVFVARWTLPVAIKGTGYVYLDLKDKMHLVPWAILAGALWAVANTLTVFAIRDVGLSIAFPLWNTNSIVGMFWGWLLFNELRGAGKSQWMKVLGGGLAIAGGACLLAFATSQHSGLAPDRTFAGIIAALGAGLLWGSMYIPYRKAYISGMNPLSFVTVFTVGELITMSSLALAFHGGLEPLTEEVKKASPALFWLFLGGFCWVLGDLFQQYAAKYVGIGRGIPLSNTNQLWGLAWGALVFGELASLSPTAVFLITAGSGVMILGALAISTAQAPVAEQSSWRTAMLRECERYGLNVRRVEEALLGSDPLAKQSPKRNWWEFVIVALAIGIFIWLASLAERRLLDVNGPWLILLSMASVAILVAAAVLLWRRTRFS